VVNKDWLDIDVLEDYLDGKLDAKTMNRAEREALEDPFVAEALAGLSASPKRALESISLLQRQLAERIDQQKSTKKQSVITWQRLSIGSAAAVLFITAGIVYWMKQVNYDKSLNAVKKVDVVIAPKEEQDTILPKTVIPEVLMLPKGEAIAQNKKMKAVAADATVAPDKVVAQEKFIAQDKVAAIAPQANLRMSRSSASAFSATAVPLPYSYDSNLVKGKILDEATGDPMVGAYVSAKDPNGVLRVIATADGKGEFSFYKNESIVDSTITISFVSYDTKVLPIKSNQLLAISLKETTNIPADEPVIRGYVKRSKEQTAGSTFIVSGKEVQDVPVGKVEQLLQGKVAGLNIQNNTGVPGIKRSIDAISVSTQSHPLDGWDHYYMYINNNSRFKGQPRVGKSVEVSFDVDTSGAAQNIKVTKGISSKYDKEAIRLIKEGPRWLQPEPKDVRIIFKIDF
jgi:outer membrane biosynthesis protein TonB